MCTVLIAFQMHPQYPLIVLSNRDEFFDRPTARAKFWDSAPNIYAGQDLKAGGAWFGVTRQAKWALVSNFRAPHMQKDNALSRGELVKNFLTQNIEPLPYLEEIAQKGQLYNGFNLLVGKANEIYYYSNHQDKILALAPGKIYGLSNALLDTPWPKVERGKKLLAELLKKQDFDGLQALKILDDQWVADESELPDTGVGLALEKALAPIFIHHPTHRYGTIASSVLMIDRAGGINFYEKFYQQQEITLARFAIEK